MNLRLGDTWRRLDADLIAQGVAKPCPMRPGLTVMILPAAMYNPRYAKALQEHAVRSVESANGSSEPTIRDRYADPDFVVNALVAGMSGIADANGDEVEYTPEIGLKVLGDPVNGDVLGWIADEAHDYGRYYTESVRADEKNSGTDSGGSRMAGVGASGKMRN